MDYGIQQGFIHLAVIKASQQEYYVGTQALQLKLVSAYHYNPRVIIDI